MANTANELFVVGSVLFGAGLYFLPTIIAAFLNRPIWWIFFYNCHLGWTVIGWFAVLAWVLYPETERWEKYRLDLRSRPWLHKILIVLYLILVGWVISTKFAS